MAGISMNAMIEQAKAERLTLERLAIDARKRGLQLLVDAYCRSIVRLNSIIRLAEIEAIPDRNQQLKELQKDICNMQIELEKLKRR